MTKRLQLLAVMAVFSTALGQPQHRGAEKHSMKTIVNGLGAEISVTPEIRKKEDLKVTLTLSSESQDPLRINGMFLLAGSLRLKFLREDGQPVPTGPPPTPRVDDGKTGRIEVLPGHPFVHTYSGGSIFGTALAPGRYTVSFSYQNAPKYPDEWHGIIETSAVPFEVLP